MRRGEIWWAAPSLRGGKRGTAGKEARLGGPFDKRRPLLVVSDDAFNRNERYPKVLVVHLTSVRRPGGPFAWEVELPRGTAGLPRGSIAKCAEVYTLWKDQLDSVAGTVPAEIMRRLDTALAIALGIHSVR